VFGLGTLPVLLGFGVLTSILSSKFTMKIVKYSGVVVILLGLVMVNRGVALTGLGYDLNTIAVSAKGTGNETAGLNQPTITENGYQVIYMNVTAYGWQPDTFTLKKGVPVKWVIDGQKLTSCNNAIQVPKLGLKFNIKPGIQTIEFTPTESGVIPWSCWMGMIPGTFIVKDDLNGANPELTQNASVNLLGCGSGGCGCGMQH
jgi:hypothetical protein